MSNFSEQQKELKVQKAIYQLEDDLVIWIQEALDTSEYGDLEEAQFRNLLRVADTTESAEVIKNFLRYQLGRTSDKKDKKDRKWGSGQNSLAQNIIKHIDDKLKPKAEKIAREANTDDFKSIWIELIRRYLGYGARYLVYKLKGQQK